MTRIQPGAQVAIAFTAILLAQQEPAAQKVPFQAHSLSTLSFSMQDNQEAVDITNVAYQVTGDGIAGRLRAERLLLRTTSRTRGTVGEIGKEVSTTIQAWPLGIAPNKKPLYTLTVEGLKSEIVNHLIVLSRGAEDARWRSVYRLGDGAHLFDTYVPLIELSVDGEFRYAGIEAPPDDVLDPRLRAPNVVAVLTYSSAAKVVREALIRCNSARLARLFRSYSDTALQATLEEHRSPSTPRTKATGEPAHYIRISFSPYYPSHDRPMTLDVPVVSDDLDLAHVTASAGLRIAAGTGSNHGGQSSVHCGR